MEMITYSVNHQKAEATTPKMKPSPQTFLTTTVQLARNVNKLLFLMSCFRVLCLQLCVHRPVRMGAGASGPTGVTAVQDGADMTAPGDLTHKHTLFQTPALLFNCSFCRGNIVFSSESVFSSSSCPFCSQEEEVSVLSLLKGRLSAPCESSYEGNSCIVARNICKPLHFHLSARGKARTIL